MAWTEVRHEDVETLSEAVATRIALLVSAAWRERAEATLVLAGGRTSPPILRRLAALPLPWRDLVVVPTDERWVPVDHPDSNLGQLQAALADAPALGMIALVPDEPEGPPDPRVARGALASIDAPFDVVMLGMGTDGHFASLFPGAANLQRALDPAGRDDAVAIVPDPMPASGAHPRISLTLPRLLRSRAVLLVATGDDKRATLERAQADASSVPIGALLHAPGARIEIHWSP